MMMSVSVTTTATAETVIDGKNLMVSNRETFRKEIDLRRTSLTPHELGFLSTLAVEGSEHEIARAHKRLSDKDLFSDHDDLTDSEDEDDDSSEDEDEAGFKIKRKSDGDLFPRRSNYAEYRKKRSSGSDLFPRSSSAVQEGSDRRREGLELRRQSQLHTQIWKAHQGGLAVTTQSSRRSLMIRSESFASSRSSQLRRASTASSRRSSTISKIRAFHGSFSNLGALSDSDQDIMSDDSEDEDGDEEDDKDNSEKVGLKPVPAPINCNFPPIPPTGMTRRRKTLSDSNLPEAASAPPTQAPLRKATTGCVSTLLRRGSSGGSRRSIFQNQKSMSSNLIDIPEVADEDASPRKERMTQEIPMWGDIQIPEDDTEEKKMSDEDQWQRKLQMRRASANSYGGEGFEIETFLEHVQDEGIMSDSEDFMDLSEDVLSDTENYEGEEEENLQQDSPTTARNKAMVMRRASVNIYGGEGMEISDWDAKDEIEERRENLGKFTHVRSASEQPHTMAFLSQAAETSIAALVSSSSFDETMTLDREECFPEVAKDRGTIQRSYSEDELSSMLTVSRVKRNRRDRRASCATLSTEVSHDDDDNESYDSFEYNAWVDSPDMEGHRLQAKDLPFRILGTSADDVDSHPHVLSPPLMESLQSFFPMAKTSDNFWLKYSMVRDGASLHTLLQHARGSQYSILAIETVDGEVMGAFTSEPWRKTWSYFGGGESFLWRMRHSRQTKCHSVLDQAQLESEIDVYPYTGENHCIQFCTSRQIAVGGGAPKETASMPTLPFGEGGAGYPMPDARSMPVIPPVDEDAVQDHEWGFGIALQSDLLQGSSSPCVTFGSPALSGTHPDGSLFEIMNIELWSMTPSFSEADAQKLELGKLFLEEHSFNAGQSTESLSQYF